MGDLVRAPGDCAEVVTFVETLLPTDTDGIQVRGIEYVRAVEVVDDPTRSADDYLGISRKLLKLDSD